MRTCKLYWIRQVLQMPTLACVCFHDSIENHTQDLSSLGKFESTYGDLLVPIILAKLPRDIRQNLTKENTSPEWNLPEIMSAILKEIRILES